MTDETIHEDVSGQKPSNDGARGTEAELENTDALANQAGGAAEEGGDYRPPASDPLSRREAKMAELNEARKKEMADQRREYWLMKNPESTADDYDAMKARENAEAQDGGEQPGDQQAEAGDPAEKPVDAQADRQDKPKGAGGWEEVDGVRYKTLMVNGEPKRISEEQYDRMVQKDMAGDDKLRRAAEAERELQRKAEMLAQREQEIQRQVTASAAANSDELKERIREHTELLLDGDVDAANEKMAEILSLGRQSSTPNLDDLTSQVATRVTTEVERRAAQAAMKKSVDDGWSHLQEHYREIVSDRDAIAFADIQVKRVKEEHPEWAPKDVIIEAAKRTREKLKLSGSATSGADKSRITTDLTAQRQQRKANIKPLPNASSQRHERKAPEPLDMSPEAKISRMRASRAL